MSVEPKLPEKVGVIGLGYVGLPLAVACQILFCCGL